MDWNTGYQVLNLLVLPAWFLLVLFPKAKVTRILVHSMLWPLVMGVLYTGFLAATLFFGQADPETGFASLSGIMALFDHPNGALLGWSHYLAFDLFIGAWIGRDGQRLGIHHWAVIPCLISTWLLGPFGLLLYIGLRLVTGKGFILENS